MFLQKSGDAQSSDVETAKILLKFLSNQKIMNQTI